MSTVTVTVTATVWFDFNDFYDSLLKENPSKHLIIKALRNENKDKNLYINLYVELNGKDEDLYNQEMMDLGMDWIRDEYDFVEEREYFGSSYDKFIEDGLLFESYESVKK